MVLWTRHRLLASGLTDAQIRRDLASGEILAVRPGVYIHASDATDLSAEQRHVLHARAAALSSFGVISHQSAAVIHGFELWRPDLRLVHMSVDRLAGGRITNRRHLHAAALPTDSVVELDGVQVTSRARTVADLLRTMRFEAAVCVGDSALGMGVDREEIGTSLGSLPTRGSAVAKNALEFLNGASESVGESRSRVFLRAFDFPEPELQVELTDDAGRFIARVDLLFDAQGVIAEFDGYVKYTSFVPVGSTPGAVAFAEKRREDDLRSHGWVVVRWVWADLAEPHALAARIRRAFAIAESMPRPRTHRRRSAHSG